MHPWLEAIGFVAGSLTTIAFLPQVLKIWRERSAAGLSVPTFLLFTLGVVLWLVYGLVANLFAVAFFNAITLALALMILAGVWRFRPRP